MPTYELPINTRNEITVGLAHHLGLDKPAPDDGKDGDWKKIVRISLRHRDERGHESEITEWEEREIYGKGISLESIVHGIELAACRDAAYQFGGDVIYVLSFHSKDTRNKSRLMFKVQGGQEVQHLALTHSMGGPMGMRGDRGGDGSPFAERIMPDVLKYVSEKEAQLDKRSMHLWDTMMKWTNHLSGVITEYTDREAKIRDIELRAEDHAYEQEKRRKEDAAREKRNEAIMKFLKEEGPKMLPGVLKIVQGFSRGPGAPYEAGMGEWLEEYQRFEAEQKNGAKGAKGVNGSGSGASQAPREPSNGAARQREQESKTIDAEFVDSEPVAAAPRAPTAQEREVLGQLQLRVALDTMRFVMLARGKDKLRAVRTHLTGKQLEIFEQVEKACDESDLERDVDVERLARLSLMFGGSVQADPASGLAMLGQLDGASRLALVDLSKLLEVYHHKLMTSGAFAAATGAASAAPAPAGGEAAAGGNVEGEKKEQ
jgi:hypothetical protein